jgi:hypothetical protein
VLSSGYQLLLLIEDRRGSENPVHRCFGYRPAITPQLRTPWDGSGDIDAKIFGDGVGETIEDLGQFHGTESGRGGDSGRQLSYQFGTPPGRLSITQCTQSCIAQVGGHRIIDSVEASNPIDHVFNQSMRLVTQRQDSVTPFHV